MPYRITMRTHIHAYQTLNGLVLIIQMRDPSQITGGDMDKT